MLEAVKKHYEVLGKKTVEALKKRKFDAYYVSSAEEAKELALKLIPATDTIGSGGSMSIDAIGLIPALKERGNEYIDRNASSDPAEKTKLMRASIMTDTYLMSANAITWDGMLFNIDGTANRVAALCYGPTQVIVVAGVNKVVPNVDAAYDRARNTAAPINKQRLGGNTPCIQNGKCGDCLCDDCICNQVLLTRHCRPAGRIKVILVGEELGF